MRVLHIGKFFPPAAGGMERFLYDLTVEQRRQGIDARAIVHHHETGKASLSEVVDTVPIRRVRTFGTMLYVPMSPTFRRNLRREIRHFQPDILHLHMPNMAGLLVLGMCRAARIPWILTWQSDVITETDGRMGLAYRAYQPFERRLLKKSRFILTSSPAYLAGSKTLQPWSDKCDAVPLGICADRVTPSADALQWAQSQWQPGQLRVLCVGRLTYYKGHRYLLDAMTRTTGVQLLVAGTGQLTQELNQQVTDLKLQDRVKLLGYVDDDRIESLMTTCDTLVLPSIERTEAFGLVLLEAMQRGKPVIATDIPHSGPAWIVRQGPSGLVVPPRDSTSLAEALMRYRDDPALREQFGTQGQAVFRQQFQMDRVAQAVTRFYERACVKDGRVN